MSPSYKRLNEMPTDVQNGDRMKQEEFHSIYEQMPDGFKAELLQGTVFVSLPLRRPHGKEHVRLGAILEAYAVNTLGVEVISEATTILGKDDEVQPDLLMRILPARGGQTRDTYDEYIQGAPELVCEIAYSSRAIDLHLKRKRYERNGVLEYIVFCLNPREIYWFDFASKIRIEPDSDGIIKSRVFPGLWICSKALLTADYQGSMKVLDLGLSSREHHDFSRRLNEYQTD